MCLNGENQLEEIADLTTNGVGVHEDAQVLVYRPPSVKKKFLDVCGLVKLIVQKL